MKYIFLLIVNLSIFELSFADNSTHQLLEKRNDWMSLVSDSDVFKCSPITPSKKACHPEDNIKPAGDMILFNALLCFSGETFSCDAIKRSQEDNGRFRRSPLHIGKKVIHKSGSFSKDHVLGLLLYFTVTKDKDSASQWYEWMENNKFGGVLSACEKAHCSITPQLFGLMYYVWKHVGLEPTIPMRRFRHINRDSLLAIEARAAKGYVLHLYGVHSLIRKIFSLETKRTIGVLSDKQPENPFYSYLRQARKSEISKMLMSKCQVLSDDRYVTENPGSQWSWERDEEEKAWRHSMGWDCIFIANLILNDSND